MAPPSVNAFYYYTFTIFDPIVCISCIYINLFAPQMFIDPAFPRSSEWANLTPSHAFLQHQFAGVFAMSAFLMVTMLPRTNDILVWKLFQTGILLTDVFTLFGLYGSVEVQGWEVRSEAVRHVVITGVMGLLRVLFVAGVGVGSGNGSGSLTEERSTKRT